LLGGEVIKGREVPPVDRLPALRNDDRHREAATRRLHRIAVELVSLVVDSVLRDHCSSPFLEPLSMSETISIEWCDRQAAADGWRLRFFPSICDPFDNVVSNTCTASS